MNAPSAVDRPSSSITAALAATVNSAAKTNISCSPRCPISLNNGRSRKRPARISPTIAATVYSASRQPGGPFASAGLRDRAATIVISGTIDRSWNSRIENARSPNGVRSRPDDCSIGSTCAVDDKASGRPSATAAASEKPAPQRMIAAIAIPQSATWSRPTPKISAFIRHKRLGFSSSPTMNSSSVMPSSATPIFPCAPPTSPSSCGPTTAPASR